MRCAEGDVNDVLENLFVELDADCCLDAVFGLVRDSLGEL